MGYFKAGKGDKLKDLNEDTKDKFDEIESFPFVAAKERGVSKETCEKFGIRAKMSQEDGKTVEAYYFPYYDQKNALIGYMRQDLTKDKSEKGHWCAINSTKGKVGIHNKLWGQHVTETVQRKKTKLILTEGQWDAVSVWQSLVDNTKGTRFEGLEPLVASIPLGTANAVESVLSNLEFVKSFDSLVIFFDDDAASSAEAKKGIIKGHEAREAVASAMAGTGVSLLTVIPNTGYKDASDYLQEGKSEELAKLVQFSQRNYTAEKIIHAGDISLDDILAPRPEGVYVESFPKLMDKLHGFRTRELVLLTSPSGVGKSTVTSIFASSFVQAGDKVGMIYLEETNKETLQRLIASKLKVNYLKFKDKPLEVSSKEKIEEVYKSIVDNDQLIMLGHFGSLPISELMSKIRHMHLVEGCKYILLDHLSMVISGSDIENERKELDMVMTELAAFCAANEVCVIAVSHINRTAAEQFKPPKGKEDEPFWIKVTKEMMRGSAALEQLSFVIIGLEPQIMPDRSRGKVRLTVLKNRPWSYLGVADEFTIDENTWEVILSPDETVDF